MKLNFTIKELIKSDTAKARGINNMPTVEQLDNILLLITQVLQPVRDLFGRKVGITSGFRSKALNDVIGGSKTSEHLKGLAADFLVDGVSVAQTVAKIRKSNIPFNQLIEEHGAGGLVWVHISYNPAGNKRQVLRYQNGSYKII